MQDTKNNEIEILTVTKPLVFYESFGETCNLKKKGEVQDEFEFCDNANKFSNLN